MELKNQIFSSILFDYFINKTYFCAPKAEANAAVAQLVEHQLPKLRVAGSSPVCRSWKRGFLMTDFLFFCYIQAFMVREAIFVHKCSRLRKPADIGAAANAYRFIRCKIINLQAARLLILQAEGY